MRRPAIPKTEVDRGLVGIGLVKGRNYSAMMHDPRDDLQAVIDQPFRSFMKSSPSQYSRSANPDGCGWPESRSRSKAEPYGEPKSRHLSVAISDGLCLARCGRFLSTAQLPPLENMARLSAKRIKTLL